MHAYIFIDRLIFHTCASLLSECKDLGQFADTQFDVNKHH